MDGEEFGSCLGAFMWRLSSEKGVELSLLFVIYTHSKEAHAVMLWRLSRIRTQRK